MLTVRHKVLRMDFFSVIIIMIVETVFYNMTREIRKSYIQPFTNFCYCLLASGGKMRLMMAAIAPSPVTLQAVPKLSIAM